MTSLRLWLFVAILDPNGSAGQAVIVLVHFTGLVCTLLAVTVDNPLVSLLAVPAFFIIKLAYYLTDKHLEYEIASRLVRIFNERYPAATLSKRDARAIAALALRHWKLRIRLRTSQEDQINELARSLAKVCENSRLNCASNHHWLAERIVPLLADD